MSEIAFWAKVLCHESMTSGLDSCVFEGHSFVIVLAPTSLLSFDVQTSRELIQGPDVFM